MAFLASPATLPPRLTIFVYAMMAVSAYPYTIRRQVDIAAFHPRLESLLSVSKSFVKKLTQSHVCGAQKSFTQLCFNQK